MSAIAWTHFCMDSAWVSILKQGKRNPKNLELLEKSWMLMEKSVTLYPGHKRPGLYLYTPPVTYSAHGYWCSSRNTNTNFSPLHQFWILPEEKKCFIFNSLHKAPTKPILLQSIPYSSGINSPVSSVILWSINYMSDLSISVTKSKLFFESSQKNTARSCLQKAL